MRVLAVDDEPLTRMTLAEILSRRSDVQGFEVVEDAYRALERLRQGPYDVLLLDIHMPGLSGLELIESLSRQTGPMPSVVFITAYQEHAVEAFEKRAVDYVLKPLVPERVHAALDVALRRSTQERSAQLIDMLRDLKLRPDRATRIAVKDKGRIVFVDIAELISAEAQGNYVLLHQRGGSYLLRETMSAVAEKLQPYGFIRIHRSVLVNRAFVETVQPSVAGGYVLRTNTGKQYPVTQTYRNNLKNLAQFWIGTEGFDPD
jgi:two-component system, LytTR family, response regulator